MSKKRKNQQRFKPKYHIKKGDIVRVLSGEDRGGEGRVLFIDTQKGHAVVEGVNMITRHTKPNSEYPDGGRIHKEGNVHISNLMLIEPKTGNPTRIGRKRNSAGKLVRYSKKTGDLID